MQFYEFTEQAVAATRVAAAWRRRAAWKTAETKRRRNAAVKIQAFFRMHLIVGFFRRVQMQKRSARFLQKRWRWYR